MTTDHFDLDDDGNIKVRPLMGYTIAPVAGMFCVVRMEYPESPEDMFAGKTSAVQLAMTAAQLREVSAVMLRKADHLDSAAPPTGPQ